MSYQVFETNVAQSANIAAGQAVAAYIQATGGVELEDLTRVYEGIFDTAFGKLKAVFDTDERAKTAATAPRSYGSGGGKRGGGGGTTDPGATVFNFGAFKGKTVEEVANMTEADAAAHGAQLQADGWTGKPYPKSGAAYLDYVANSKNENMSFMKKVVSNYLDSKRA